MIEPKSEREALSALRRRCLWIDKTDGRPLTGGAPRARRVYQLAYWRTRYARAAPTAVRRFGPDVERAWGVPLRDQRAQLREVALRYGVNANMYYRYRMYLLDSLDGAATYVPVGLHKAARSAFYRRFGLDGSINDKTAFAVRCREEGIRTIPSVATFSGSGVEWGAAAADGQLPPRDLFGKPAFSVGGGGGAERWWWDGDRYRSEDGELYDPPALVHLLRERSVDVPYLLQPRLVNVPSLQPLCENTLGTVRAITVSVSGESPVHVGSLLRIPLRDTPIDNFSAGGVAAPVGAETGRLGPAVSKALDLAAGDHAVHPRTGHPIAGVALPQWEEVVDVAVRAHGVYPGLPIVGWDIAVSTDGVVLVEGNSNPSILTAQQVGRRPLGSTAYPRAMLAAFGEPA